MRDELAVPNKLRIAMVAGHFLPLLGGVEVHVEHIARCLAARGHHVEVFTQRDERAWPAFEQLDGMTIRRFAVPLPIRNLTVSPALVGELRRRSSEFDVVHAHNYHTFAPLAAMTAGCRPLVFTPHYHGTGHSPLRKALHKPYRRLGARIIRSSSRIICVSRAEAQLLESHFPFSRERITVIPNGVDVGALRAAEPMPWPGKLVVSAGRLESYKHVETTVAAMAHLPTDFSLIVTGDGPERRRLETTIAELALRARVRLLGRVDLDELWRWYRRADVYVSMSANEAFSLTVAEALAAGARVVASDIPAHRELAEIGGEAIELLPTSVTPAVLAASIRSAAEAPRPDARKFLTWGDVADCTESVYREAMQGA